MVEIHVLAHKLFSLQITNISVPRIKFAKKSLHITYAIILCLYIVKWLMLMMKIIYLTPQEIPNLLPYINSIDSLASLSFLSETFCWHM